MSAPTMNEDAIAALFAAAQDGQMPTEGAAETRPTAPTVRPVDFRRPRQFTGEIQRRLRRSLDTFCRTASSRLSSELRTAVDLEVIGVDQLTWSDAHGQLAGSSVTAMLATEPHGTRMVAAAELPLLLTAIERMLGGSADTPQPARRLTDIDMMLAGSVFEILVDQLSIIWSEQIEVGLTLAGVVASQQTAQLAPMSEPTLTFTVEVGLMGSPSTITLLVPYRSILPMLDRLTAADGADQSGDAWTAEAMRTGIGEVAMEVRAEVGAVDLAMTDVLAIRPGDLVSLGSSARAGVTLFVDSTPVGSGQPGRSGVRRAVQTTSVVSGVG